MGLKLIGEVALDGSGFEAGLKRIEGAVHHAGEALKGLAVSAIGIYGIEQAISKTIETGEQLVNTSRRIGIGLEALQELGYAAKQNGADIDQLTTFIEKLNSTRIDPKNLAAFRRFGINDPLHGDVVDLVMQLSANVRNRSSQEVIGPLREIGGRDAGSILVTLKSNLEGLREEAKELGVIISTDALVTLKYLKDEFLDLAAVIGAQLAPVIANATRTILHGINLVKAAAGAVSEVLQKVSLKRLLTGFLPIAGGDRNDLASALGTASVTFETRLAAMNQITDKNLEMLVEKQKQYERINAFPEMRPIAEFKGAQPYTDSLLRVGNFLGSANNPVLSVAQLQLAVLRQIAANTSKTNGPDQILPPL